MKQIETCQLAIEQSFITLTDICHFLFVGDAHLQALSQSALVQKTVKLVLNCEMFAPLLTIRIFRRASLFLKELSNDNPHTRSLLSQELTTCVQSYVLNAENVDFYWNVLEFWLNLLLEQSLLTQDAIALIRQRQQQL